MKQVSTVAVRERLRMLARSTKRGLWKRLKALKDHAENDYRESELSEKQLLQGMLKILDAIEVHHKEWTGGRMKKYSTIKTRVFAGRLPVDLLNEVHKFRGSNTYHLVLCPSNIWRCETTYQAVIAVAV